MNKPRIAAQQNTVQTPTKTSDSAADTLGSQGGGRERGTNISCCGNSCPKHHRTPGSCEQPAPLSTSAPQANPINHQYGSDCSWCTLKWKGKALQDSLLLIHATHFGQERFRKEGNSREHQRKTQVSLISFPSEKIPKQNPS